VTRIQSAAFSCGKDKKSTHYHDAHQIIFVDSGGCRVKINGREFDAKAGEVILISRYESHSVDVTLDPYERYVFRISPSNEGLSDILSNRPEGFSNCIKTGESEAEIRSLCEKICREWQGDALYREEMLDLYLSALFILLERLAPARQSSALVSQVKRRLEADFREAFSLASLSQEYSVSESRLSHEFKRVTGVSVMEYLFSTRLAESKRLLTHTALRVGEIVERCGFSDPSNFTRAFKRCTGLSPLEFRRAYTKTV